MSRRRRLDTFTGETRQEKAKRIIAANVELRKAAYAALCTDDGWSAFLRARCLHRYSWRNCALIAYQRPDALALATFSQWQASGYVVAKGETSTVTITTRRAGGFGSCSLFDATQTGMPITAPEDVLPEGFETTYQSLCERVSRPETLDAVKDAGDAVQAAYDALTSAERQDA